MKKLTILTVALLLTALVQLTAQPVQAEVSIPDAPLAAAIRFTLDLPPGAAITADAMLDLTRLYAPEKRITDLTGLEHATNLTELNLRDTAVSDVSPLAGLTQLRELHLEHTYVSDVSSLAGLTQLTYLDLRDCPLSYASFHTHIPAMQAKGIGVIFDNVADVNGDGVVNIQDLVLVAGQFGETREDIPADVNGDGVVNIQDLVFVAGALN